MMTVPDNRLDHAIARLAAQYESARARIEAELEQQEARLRRIEARLDAREDKDEQR